MIYNRQYYSYSSINFLDSWPYAHIRHGRIGQIMIKTRADDYGYFSRAGRELARLHLEYENGFPLKEFRVVNGNGNYHVSKMRFAENGKKDIIICLGL